MLLEYVSPLIAPSLSSPEKFQEVRDAVRHLCRQFHDEYHRQIDEKRVCPEDFVNGVDCRSDSAGERCTGLYTTEASVIIEEINRYRGNSGACHGQTYVMNTIVFSGPQVQQDRYLPHIVAGELCVQPKGCIEPTTGSNTTRANTTAVSKEERWVIHGQKVGISLEKPSELPSLLAVTTPPAHLQRKNGGTSCFIVEFAKAIDIDIDIDIDIGLTAKRACTRSRSSPST